nr:hypothetical protein [Clostridiales bacterium]
NQLTMLDVSKNIALKTLACFGNQLTTLDVSKNTALVDLRCYNNCYSALCMRGKPFEIVKFNVTCSSWRKTRNSSQSMRFFHEQDLPLTA